MTYYAVVTRDKRKLPIDHFLSIEGAGDFIVKERRYHEWSVLAQDGGKSAPYRDLNRSEKKRLEKRLYPSLFE